MKKLIVICMFLGLLTGVGYAQRGRGRIGETPNIRGGRVAPNVMGSSRSFGAVPPNVMGSSRSIGAVPPGARMDPSGMSSMGASNVGASHNIQNVKPDLNPASVRPDVNPKSTNVNRTTPSSKVGSDIGATDPNIRR